MENAEFSSKTHRRGFIGTLATGAAAMGLATFGTPFPLAAQGEDAFKTYEDADAWFGQIKGKHRIMFDVPHAGDPAMMPFAWSRVFLLTNQATGTPEKDLNVVVIMRHSGIPFAFEDRIWSTYKLGEFFKVNDPKTNASSVRNPFWKPKQGDYQLPGFGNLDIGIDQLMASGVMFGVCDAAMTVYSAAMAAEIKQDPATVKKDWMSGLLPGVQVMPSGVWAVGRAQEHGCAYCFAG
jgi:intracellular sulfur oxidation DsrE/DsrF family protein